jgi:hypothetical protein
MTQVPEILLASIFLMSDMLLAKNVFCVELSMRDEPTQVQYVNSTIQSPLNEYSRQFAICEYCHWMLLQ